MAADEETRAAEYRAQESRRAAAYAARKRALRAPAAPLAALKSRWGPLIGRRRDELTSWAEDAER